MSIDTQLDAVLPAMVPADEQIVDALGNASEALAFLGWASNQRDTAALGFANLTLLDSPRVSGSPTRLPAVDGYSLIPTGPEVATSLAAIAAPIFRQLGNTVIADVLDFQAETGQPLKDPS